MLQCEDRLWFHVPGKQMDPQAECCKTWRIQMNVYLFTVWAGEVLIGEGVCGFWLPDVLAAWLGPTRGFQPGAWWQFRRISLRSRSKEALANIVFEGLQEITGCYCSQSFEQWVDVPAWLGSKRRYCCEFKRMKFVRKWSFLVTLAGSWENRWRTRDEEV